MDSLFDIPTQDEIDDLDFVFNKFEAEHEDENDFLPRQSECSFD